MIKALADGSKPAKAMLAKLERRSTGPRKVESEVAAILAAVRREGDRALLRYTKRFDGVALTPRSMLVGKREMERARAAVPPATMAALRSAHRRITRFHKLQRERGYELVEAGIRTGMRVLPMARAGVYVPGGKAAYPSSVLMNVVPARVAGVPDITVATPPQPAGIKPEVLVAAEMAGAGRIIKVGGAQAVAALAYGTKTVARVDKIVGPGNIYVATAKRLVFGEVDIDMIAGPSEVLIIADGGADPELVAADMLAQAEHDELAAAICLSSSSRVASRVAEAVDRQLRSLSRAPIARKSLARYGSIIVVPSLKRAVELANQIAPEHLELFVAEPRKWLAGVLNAGAVFLGECSSEPLGDYAAGPNHVLPTGGSARFSSPLGVYDFLKRTSIIEVDREGLDSLARPVLELARCEGLEAHGLAVTRRLQKDPQSRKGGGRRSLKGRRR